MNLTKLKSIFSANGCNKIYIKSLAANDNSKNQVYFSGSFDILNALPLSEIKNDGNNWKAKINFAWIGEDGSLSIAPKSQFILYPQYPEVRFSGFLISCKNAPSALMASRIPNRLLFFGVSSNNQVIGYVVSPDSEVSNEFISTTPLENYGVFKVIELPIFQNNREKLLSELLRIHNLGWIKSKKLNSLGQIVSCEAPNCGGFTLEAELGIIPNSNALPDFLGWEIKQFGVTNFEKLGSRVITLMTPEPTDGFYKTEGVEAFIRRYGYLDTLGREDRMNFGGIYKSGLIQARTKLKLELIGYDFEKRIIADPNGKIALMDENNNETASWSYSSLLKHWTEKHNQACYIPSLSKADEGRNYRYGNNIMLGTGTDFQLFLNEMADGNVYYDPGIKLENISTKPKAKKRSQFRIKSSNLSNLYIKNEIIDITKQ